MAITKEDLGKKKDILCNVTKIEKPYIKVKSIRWECPSCGSILKTLQMNEKVREPRRCACGRKGGFKIIDKEVVEAQEITIMEKETFFEYKVYLEGKVLLDKVKTIKSDFILKGEIQDEYKKNSTKGEFVILARDIK